MSIWGAELTPLRRPVIGLAEAVKKYSLIETKLDKRLPLSSPELEKYPFIYIGTDEEFELTEIERKSFSRYLNKGGFAVIDNCFPQERFGDAEASLRKMLRDAKTDIGARAVISIITPFHPVYHSFFDFDYGPPLGAELLPAEMFNSKKNVLDKEYHTDPYLEGLWIGSRLAAVYSDRGYGLRWQQLSGNEPQQKFGVNLVVYALTHKGGVNRPQVSPLAVRR